jgi:hypothetical protein
MAETEYGVELPNGDVHWGIALTRPIATPEDRKQFLEIVKNTAKEIGFPEDEFVKGYKWRTRDITVSGTTWHLTDPSALPEPEAEPS